MSLSSLAIPLSKSDFETLEDLQKQSLWNAFDKMQDWTNYWEIKIIRENPWPLVIANDSLLDDFSVAEIEKNFWIPRCIVLELFSILQASNFVPWTKIMIWDDAREKFSTKDSLEIFLDWIIAESNATKEDFVEALNIFFSNLWKLPIIKEWKEKQKTNDDIAYWLFRIVSLFDINFSKFESIDDLLNFLYTWVEMQESFFWDDYLHMIETTSWIPINDIKWKETTRFDNEKYVFNLWEFEFFAEKYSLSFRVFPWFSPLGIWCALSLDLPNVEWTGNSNSNYMFILWINFELVWTSVIPVIHTIQNSFHNIWIDFSQKKLFHVNEPLSLDLKKMWINILETEESDDEKTIKSKRKIKQDMLVAMKNDIFSWLEPENEILALIIDKLLSHYFSFVWCKHGKDNLWLTKHSWRDEESIEQTSENLYWKRIKALWWEYDEKLWMYTVKQWDVLRYLWAYPWTTRKINEISQSIDWLVAKLRWLEKALANNWLDLTNKKINNTIQTIRIDCDTIIKAFKNFKGRSDNIESFAHAYNSVIDENIWEIDVSDLKDRTTFINAISSYRAKDKWPKNLAEEKLVFAKHDLYNSSVFLALLPDLREIKARIDLILESNSI